MRTEPTLILGSSSQFRQQQLRTLGIPFTAEKTSFDETPFPNESAEETALRLAVGKAQSLRTIFPNHLIIGADQVAWCRNKQLGKPLTVAKAQQMLSELSGQTIIFYSALCLLNSTNGNLQTHVDKTVVTMRTLSAGQIQNYLCREPDAVHCAGAAKSEGLGAVLIQKIESTDPNALIGLPIFKLIDFLEAENFPLLK